MEKLETELFIGYTNQMAGAVAPGITSQAAAQAWWKSQGIWPDDPPVDDKVRFKVVDMQDQFKKTLVATMELSMRELQMAKDDFMAHAIRNVSRQLEAEIERFMTSVEFRDLARDIIKEEMKKQMADRIDEFVKELTEDM